MTAAGEHSWRHFELLQMNYIILTPFIFVVVTSPANSLCSHKFKIQQLKANPFQAIVLRLLRPETSKYLFRRHHAYAVVKDIVIINLLWELLSKEATFSFWWIFITDLSDSRGGIL